MAEAFLDRVSSKALGELLIEHGCISQQQCEQALAEARREGIRLGEALIRLGHITPDLLSLALGEQFGVRPVGLQPSMVDPDLLRRFPSDLLERHTMLPLIELGDELVVLISDPHNHDGLRLLREFAPGSRITVQLAAEAQIRRCLTMHPGSGGLALFESPAPPDETGSATPAPDDASEESFVRWLLTEALQAPDADLVLRSDRTRAFVSRSGGGVSQSLHEFHGALFAPVCEAIWKQCEELSFTGGRAAVWSSPLRFAGQVFTIQVVRSRDLAGTRLRLRPMVYVSRSIEEPQGRPDPGAAGTFPLTLALYETPENLERYLDQLIADRSGGARTCVLFQETTRRVYPSALSFPGSCTDAAAAVLATGATTVLFDYPPGPETLEQLGWLSLQGRELVVCAPAPRPSANGNPPRRPALSLLRSFHPRVIILESDGTREIDTAAALESFGGTY